MPNNYWLLSNRNLILENNFCFLSLALLRFTQVFEKGTKRFEPELIRSGSIGNWVFNKELNVRGQNSTTVSILASRSKSPGFNTQRYKIFSDEKKSILLRLINECCLEVSGHWLENVNQILFFPASGKLVLQKKEKKDLNFSFST